MTHLQWWLDAPLPSGTAVIVQFQALVPTNFVSGLIENCAGVGFGDTPSVEEDCQTVFIKGDNSLSGTVFEDVGSSNNFANALMETNDVLEVGITNVVVSLYYDQDGDGVGDVFWDSVLSDVNGDYAFTNLPDSYFVVSVDPLDSNIPTNYGPTTESSLLVDLDAAGTNSNPVISTDHDFGFAPPLTLDKQIQTNPVLEGQELIYSIDVKNNLQAASSGSSEGQALYISETLAVPPSILVVDPTSYSTSRISITSSTIQSIAIDEVNSKIYISDLSSNLVYRMDLDGSNPEIFVDLGLNVISYIEVDEVNGYLFVSDVTAGNIVRYNLDGTGSGTNVVTGLTATRGLAVDSVNGKLYYTQDSGEIYESNLDGTGETFIADITANPDDVSDIEIDPAAGILYVAQDLVAHRVVTVDIATGTITTLYNLTSAVGVAIDPDTGTLWVTTSVGHLYKGSMDGTASLTDAGLTFGASFDVDLVGSGSGGGSLRYDPISTMIDVTLTDDYDPTELAFVSASLAPDSVNTTNGLITWDDIGPIFGGATKSIQVTFKALGQAGNSDYTFTNAAAVTSSSFVNGKAGNTPSDEAVAVMKPTGSIAGTLWADDDGDGWQTGTAPGNTGYESGENGIAGVTVTLHICDSAPPTSGGSKGDCTGTESTVTTTTDMNGDYLFDGLATGLWYSVVVDATTIPGTSVDQTGDPEDDSVNGYGNAGTCGTGGSNAKCSDSWDNGFAWLELSIESWADADGTNQSWEVTNINFGYDGVSPTIYGYVWHDLNGDGIWDPIEPPLSGVTVNASGADTASAVTGADGSYRIEQDSSAGDLNTGSYTLVTTNLPAGVTWTATGESVTNDFGVTNSDSTTNNNIQFSLSGSSEQSGNWNFGFQCTGSYEIGDTVYFDYDADGVQSTNDSGIVGVDIELWLDLNGDGGATPGIDYYIGADTTDTNGTYLFTSLAPGDYIVVVDQADIPTDYIQTADPDEAGRQCSTCDSLSTTTLSNTNDYAQDFGYTPIGSGVIGDTVFFDDNGSGTQGSSELGISNVTVQLWVDLDTNGTYETMLGIEVTDVNGNYLFERLPDADYQVVIETTDPDIPSDRLISTVSDYEITLSGGVATEINGVTCSSDCALDADFGFSPLGAIGDFVFYDANNNGTQDYSEEGITNVTLVLWTDPNGDGDTSDGVALATNVTADGSGAFPAGYYQFDGLEPGYYVVKVDDTSLPYVGGSPIPQTADPDRDGVACDDNTYPLMPACDNEDTTILLGYGSTYTGADFGYQPAGVIGDYVWFDIDGDGVQDLGENGISGVTVTATLGTNVYVVTTDFDGYYSFANLPDGDWTITVSNPTNMTASFDVDGSLDLTASVTITNGSVSTNGNTWCGTSDCSLDIDFGFELNGLYDLSGTIGIDDSTEDGVITSTNDVPLEAMTVYLYNSSGTYLGSTLTDTNGNYNFSGLPDDSYFVVTDTTVPPLDVTDLTTTVSDTPATNLAVHTSSVVQTVPLNGASVTDVDFAFVYNVLLDFGDLPISYSTISSDSPVGPSHIITTNQTLYLGTIPDSESNGSPSALADGDGADEDGITFNSADTWVDGTNGGNITVSSSGNGWLVGWIDFNQDGDFLDVGEMMVSLQLTNTNTTVSFDIPTGTFSNSVTELFSRFRLFEDEPPLPQFAFTGRAQGGEVEDHRIPRGGSADLELTKTVNEAKPLVGGTVTFTITVTNAGPSTATGVDVTDDVPNGYSSMSNISGSGALSGSSITWSNMTLANGDITNLTFDAVVNSSGNYTNWAEITGMNGTDVDSDPDSDRTVDDLGDSTADDDEDYAVVCPHPVITCPADITIECGSDTSPASAGSATDSSPCDCSNNVSFADNFIAGSCDFERTVTRTWIVTDSCGGSNQCEQTISIVDTTAPTLTCPGYYRVLADTNGFGQVPDLTAIVSASDACSTVTITQNVAVATVFDGSMSVTVTAQDDCGNQDSCIITVEETNTCFQIEKFVTPGGVVNIGSTISYTIRVSNTVSLAQHDVTVKDILPDTLVYTEGTAKMRLSGVVSGQMVEAWSAQDYESVGGAAQWLDGWQETGEQTYPIGGAMQVVTDGAEVYALRMSDANKEIERAADLSAFTSAELNLDYRREGLDDSGDSVAILVQADGGAWNQVGIIQGAGTDGSYQPFSADISSYISTSTVVRFSNSVMDAVDYVYLDNIRIDLEGTAVSNVPVAGPLTMVSDLTVAGEEVLEITFDAVVKNPPTQIDFVNTALVYSVECPALDAVAIVSNSVNASSGMGLIASYCDDSPVHPGQIIDYNIYLENTGDVVETSVDISQFLSDTLHYVPDTAQVVDYQSHSFYDAFDQVSYQNNDGTRSWSGSWMEVNESDGPDLGKLIVHDQLERLFVRNNDVKVWRVVDLSGFTNAALNFWANVGSLEDSGEYITVEASGDGGASWGEIHRWTGPLAQDGDVGYKNLNLTAYVASNTAIRFATSDGCDEDNDLAMIDEVKILAGGLKTDGLTPPNVVSNLTINPGESFDINLQAEVQFGSFIVNTSTVTTALNPNGFISVVTNPIHLISATQGVHEVHTTASETNAIQFGWTIIETNYSCFVPYDVVCVDCHLGFGTFLNGGWKGSYRVTNNAAIVDAGGEYLDQSPRRHPYGVTNDMRFYRAAVEESWTGEKDITFASAEVYGLRNVFLKPGQNWVALPGIHDVPKPGYVFGHDYLPSGVLPAQSTRLTWFNRSNDGVSKTEIYLADHGSSNQWMYSVGGSGSAEGFSVPEDDGIVITLPDGAPETHFSCIAKVPKLPLQQTLKKGYNLIAKCIPRQQDLSETGLTESGFRGAPFPPGGGGNGDMVWKWDRDQQQVLSGHLLWYSDGSLPSASPAGWYFTIWQNSKWKAVPDRATWWNNSYIGIDDAIVVYRPNNPSDLSYTNKLLYIPPNVYMNP